MVVLMSQTTQAPNDGNIDLSKYKIEDYESVSVMAESNVWCDWKPDRINDGFKTCNVEISVRNNGVDNLGLIINPTNFQIDVSMDTRDGITFQYGTAPNLDKDEIEYSNWRDMDGSILSIRTDEYIGIKATFEIPQYAEASYNFTYLPLGLVLDPDITKCGGISGAGGIFTLTQNLTTTGNCIKINTDDVHIDLNGFTLTGDGDVDDLGVWSRVNLFENASVFNGTITNFGHGIALRTTGGSFYDLDTSDNTERGLYLINILDAGNNLIHDIVSNNNEVGIYITVNDNTTLHNNTLNNNEIGMFFGNSENTTASDNTFDNNSIYGIQLRQGSTFNSFFRNIITNSDIGVFINFGSENSFWRDMIILNSTTNSVSIVQDVGGPVINHTFLNVTYNIFEESVVGNADLFRLWYYRAFVNDSEGNLVNNATVQGLNVTNVSNFNLTTNSSGLTEIFNIIDYFNFNDTRSFWSNYNISATNVTCTDFHFFNVTEEMNELRDVFTLCGAVVPPTPPNASNVVIVIAEDEIFPVAILGQATARASIPYAQLGQELNFTEFNVLQLGNNFTAPSIIGLVPGIKVFEVVPNNQLNRTKEFSDIGVIELGVAGT